MTDLIDENNQLRFILSILAAVKEGRRLDRVGWGRVSGFFDD